MPESLIWCLQHQSFGRGRPYQRISRRIRPCAMQDSAKGIYSHSTVARTIILRPAVQATVGGDNWRLSLEGTIRLAPSDDKHEGHSLCAIKRDAGRIHSSSKAQSEEASHRSLRHALSSTTHSTNSPPTHIHMKTWSQKHYEDHPSLVVITQHRCITPPL